MNRRNFLQAMLAACAAPAIVKAENIMRINPRIITPEATLLRTAFIDKVIDDSVMHLALIDPYGKVLSTTTVPVDFDNKQTATFDPIAKSGVVDHVRIQTPWGTFEDRTAVPRPMTLLTADTVRLANPNALLQAP